MFFISFCYNYWPQFRETFSRANIKNCHITSQFYAISCDQKCVIPHFEGKNLDRPCLIYTWTFLCLYPQLLILSITLWGHMYHIPIRKQEYYQINEIIKSHKRKIILVPFYNFYKAVVFLNKKFIIHHYGQL